MRSSKSFDSLKLQLIERSREPSLILSRLEHKILFANEAAKALLKLGLQEGLLFDGLVPDRRVEGFQDLSLDLLEQSGVYSNVLMKNFEGGHLLVNLSVQTFLPDQGALIALFIQDLTLQLKMQRDLEEKQKAILEVNEDLLRQNEQLKQLDATKDKFIGLMTHELRTPLSAVLATLDFIRQGFYDSPEEMKELLQTAHEQGEHLSTLINDILDYSKLKAGRMEFQPEPSALYDICESSQKAFASFAEKNEVIVRLDSSLERLPLAMIDRTRLRQVVDNLLSNAIKFNHPQGEVIFKGREEEEFLVLIVADTGKGIAKENETKIFDEFETLGQLSQHQAGTGLGLPISKKIIDLMQGRLEFRSRAGEGTEFFVYLPKAAHKTAAA